MTVPNLGNLEMTADALDRVRRLAGEDSAEYRLAKRQHESWIAYQTETTRENERLKAARLAALEEERGAKRREWAERDESRLRDHLGGAFRAANPTATAHDFDKLYPRLREEHLVREALAGADREKSALAAKGGYAM